MIVRALIGDKDIDEVSELSESMSVASSEDHALYTSLMTKEADSVGGGDNLSSLEVQQRDLEHTEYAVMPTRRESERGGDQGGQIRFRGDADDDAYDDNAVFTLSAAAKRALSSPPDLEFVSSPPDALVTEEGGVLTLQCQMGGTKPIGELVCS